MPPKKRQAKKDTTNEPKVTKQVKKNNEQKEEEEEEEDTKIDPLLIKELPTQITYSPDEQPKQPYEKTSVEVDSFCALKDKLSVYKKTKKTYASTLNKSSMVGGVNTNKFYIVQVLYEKANLNNFYLYKRWGRVGEEGTHAMIGPQKEQDILLQYDERIIDRTMRCKYTEVITEEEEEEVETGDKQKQQQQQKQKEQASLLDSSVQNLMSLIFDVKIQQQTLKEIGYDPKKCPLGKLAQSQIEEGYKVLNKIDSAIKLKLDKKTMEELSSQFYSLIPHDFGRQKMTEFIINEEKILKSKLEMLQALTDMKITNDLTANKNIDSNYHIIDQNYKKLNCDLKPLTKDQEMYQNITKYIDNTKQNWKTDIVDIFEVTRPGEDQRYKKDIGNDILLWHGSRISNYGGILSQGLRIAPPEAPVSGYLYGKGIYLADMFDKSAHYCRGGTNDNTILIMLIQGAIGKPNELHSPNCNAADLPKGTHSVLGWGQQGPPKSTYVNSKHGQIPLGKPQRTKSSTYMGHNEFIVYNVNQAQIKYLIRVKASQGYW